MKVHFNQAHRLSEFLRGTHKVRCQNCFASFKDHWNHKEHCEFLDFGTRPYPSLLSFNGRTFLCMFGCDSEQQKFYNKRSRLFDHLIEAHTDEELEGWGIN